MQCVCVCVLVWSSICLEKRAEVRTIALPLLMLIDGAGQQQVDDRVACCSLSPNAFQSVCFINIRNGCDSLAGW